MQQPVREEWQSLYHAADAFKTTKPWNWMQDDEIFGVQDPDTGMTYYCSIMGNGGTHFGIVAYRGTNGLHILENMIYSANELEIALDLPYINDCLECSFEDRDMMKKEDLAVIKQLGLKYRGRNQWPSFLDHSPGLLPWFLDSTQCKILTLILSQALEVAVRCRKDKAILNAKEGAFLVRCLKKNQDRQDVWQDAYLVPRTYKKTIQTYDISDELLVQKLQKTKIQKDLEVEVDIFHAPVPVADDERPYFPQMCAIVNKNTGMVLSIDIAENHENAGYNFLTMMTEWISKQNKKPGRIFMARPETINVFEKYCKKAKIGIKIVGELPALTEFRLGLMESSGQ